MYNKRMMNESDDLYKLFRRLMDEEMHEESPTEQSKEARMEILSRIAKSSNGVADRDYALDNRTWVVALNRPIGVRSACLTVVPVDKTWLRVLQFKNAEMALESIRTNENDWYRFLA